MGAALALTTTLALSACGRMEAAPMPSASTAAPVTIDELGQGAQDGPVDLDVSGPTQVTYRKITIKPGGGTGLHCHYGQLIAVVGQGVFTHYAPMYPGGVHEYHVGDSIIEGADYVHEGTNEGTEDMVLWVTYLTPEGKPLAEADLSKCNA